MNSGKILSQIVNENDISLNRRVNMMGQQLADAGFEKVKVTLNVTIECVDSDGSGKVKKKIEGSYSGYKTANATTVTSVTSVTPAAPGTPPQQSLPSGWGGNGNSGN